MSYSTCFLAASCAWWKLESAPSSCSSAQQPGEREGGEGGSGSLPCRVSSSALSRTLALRRCPAASGQLEEDEDEDEDEDEYPNDEAMNDRLLRLPDPMHSSDRLCL